MYLCSVKQKSLIIMALAVLTIGSCAQRPLKEEKTMDFFEVIRNRKSVRAYQDKEVEPEKLKTIVEAGNMAAGTKRSGYNCATR